MWGGLLARLAIKNTTANHDRKKAAFNIGEFKPIPSDSRKHNRGLAAEYLGVQPMDQVAAVVEHIHRHLAEAAKFEIVNVGASGHQNTQGPMGEGWEI